MLAIAAHMYASLRVIYSWPMDTASPVTTSNTTSTISWTASSTLEAVNATTFIYADKYPGYRPYALTLQPWMSPSQRAIFPIYKIATLLVMAVVVCIYVIIPVGLFLRRMFTKVGDFEIDHVADIPYSIVPRILTYVPITGNLRCVQGLCAKLIFLLSRRRICECLMCRCHWNLCATFTTLFS